MKEELKGFENREDDWLAREMRREAKLSPWNVDEAKIIKEEHARIHAKEIRLHQKKWAKRRERKEIVPYLDDETRGILILVYFVVALIIYIIFKVL